MKSTIVCLVIAAVFVYASAMPAVGDTAVPGTPAAPKTPPAAPAIAPAAPAVAPAAPAVAPAAPAVAPAAPAVPLAGVNPAAVFTDFVGKGMKAFAATLGSFGR